MRNTNALKQVYESPARKQPSPDPKMGAIKRRLAEQGTKIQDRFKSRKRTNG